MNKKGITLVEIIISIVLISIVLIFLFSLLVTVNDINKESEVNSTYLINKSLILKNIEEDLSKATNVQLGSCSINNFYTSYNTDALSTELKANRCLNFKFNEGTSEESNAYLGIYYYKRSDTNSDKNGYVISYIHEKTNVRATRQLPDFELNNVDSSGSLKLEWKYNNTEEITSTFSQTLNNNKFHKINIPIIGSDGKDYSINISYYKNS